MQKYSSDIFLSADVEAAYHALDAVDGGSCVGHVHEMPEPQPEPQASNPEFSWTKQDGNWAVRAWDAPDAQPGDTVTVTSRNNPDGKPVVLGQLLSEDRKVRVFAVGQKQERQEAASVADVTAGMYRNGDTILRVYLGQRSGKLLVKELVGDTAHGFEYDYRGAVEGKARQLVAGAERLSLEEAKRFGKMSGHCCVCARQLDNPESVDAGIGPVCASRMESGQW